MILDTFDAWKIYQAIKLHYQSRSYNYFKYHGKVKNDWNRFVKEKQKRIFTGLARKYKSNYEYFIAVSFLKNPDIKWVGELYENEYQEWFYESVKYIETQPRQFSLDIQSIITIGKQNEVTRFIDMLIPTENKLPPIVKLHKAGLTKIETSVTLNIILNWVDNICISIDDPLWEYEKHRMTCFSPFIYPKLNLDKLKHNLKHNLRGN